MAPTFLGVTAQVLREAIRSAQPAPSLPCPLLLPFSPSSLWSSHTGLLAVPPTGQAWSCFRAFAQAVPSARSTLPKDTHTTHFLTSGHLRQAPPTPSWNPDVSALPTLCPPLLPHHTQAAGSVGLETAAWPSLSEMQNPGAQARSPRPAPDQDPTGIHVHHTL